MQPVELRFGADAVPTFIGTDCGAEMQQRLRALTPAPDKFFVCTERSIYDLCGGEKIFTALGLGAAVELVAMGKGEAEKSAETLMAMTAQCFAGGVSKRSVVVAFGGGIVLNVAGLLAALVYRGIRLVHVPTTLMAQHDVITSIKTAVNLCGRKNNFGTYYSSLLNLVDVGFLRTLPEAQYWSGLGELCKNALLLGGEHAAAFELVMRQWRHEGVDLALHNEALVAIGIKAKARYLAVDAREKTTAMIFEYGHTTAHALERSYPDEVLPHGVAVCWGMLACSYVAEQMGLMTAAERREHDAVIELLGLELPEPRPPLAAVMEKVMRDNKRGLVMEAADETSEVLLHRMGAPVESKSMLHAIKADSVREWLVSVGFEDPEK
jgi:3-dehydroquinate synthase/2-deoxy-scyllo-inosose synthase